MFHKLLSNLKQGVFKKSMYPEIKKAGGLQNALDLAFEKIGSTIRVTKDELDNFPVVYGIVEKGQKYSQVYIAAEKKLYLNDFWKEGVCLAHGSINDITQLVTVIDFWLCNDITIKELSEKYNFVVPNEKALAFDENREVEYTWNVILNDEHRSEIRSFVELAVKDDQLNKLFPFTSLYTLCFSKCTGYPYDCEGLPTVSPNLDGSFVVKDFNNNVLGQGNAEEALRLVKNNLPKNIQPAIKGTAEDLNK